MPKTTGTRRQAAQSLLKRLNEGPSMSCPAHGIDELSNNEVAEYFAKCTRLWLSTWITPEVKKLIPELRAKKE